MAYQRFSLFPDSPSFKDLFSARSMRYRWRNGDPVITVAIMVICVAVWIVETLLKIAWPAGYNSFVGTGVFCPRWRPTAHGLSLRQCSCTSRPPYGIFFSTC